MPAAELSNGQSLDPAVDDPLDAVTSFLDSATFCLLPTAEYFSKQRKKIERNAQRLWG